MGTSGISQKPATAYRPFNPPPEPPQSRPRSNQSSRQNIVDLPPAPQETSFDYEPASLPPAPPLTGRPLDQEPQSGQARILRAKSMGEILETNLDDEGESTPVLASQANGHSRSMQLLNSGKLSMNASLLETDMKHTWLPGPGITRCRLPQICCMPKTYSGILSQLTLKCIAYQTIYGTTSCDLH